MLTNLRAELKNKNITIVQFAKILDLSEKTIQNKLNGETEFTWGEIKTISTLFPQFKIEYLFATSDQAS